MQVTDEMVEAACARHWPGPWPGDRRDAVLDMRRRDMRGALAAAWSLVDTTKNDADLIKQMVRLALANLDPSGADRLPLDEWVEQTLLAMGSATTSKGCADE